MTFTNSTLFLINKIIGTNSHFGMIGYVRSKKSEPQPVGMSTRKPFRVGSIAKMANIANKHKNKNKNKNSKKEKKDEEKTKPHF